MKMRMKSMFFVPALILIAAGGFAQPIQRARPEMRDRLAHMQRSPSSILFVLKARQEELNITKEQLNQIEEMTFAFEEKMIAMESEARTSRLEMKRHMMDRENLDYGKIKTALDKAADKRSEMFIARLMHREDLMNVLTPEQQDALKSMIKDRLRDRRAFLRNRRFPGERQDPRFPRLRERFENQER